MQSMPLTIKFLSLIPAHGELYIVSDVRHNDGFILVLWFSPPTSTQYADNVESSIK